MTTETPEELFREAAALAEKGQTLPAVAAISRAHSLLIQQLGDGLRNTYQQLKTVVDALVEAGVIELTPDNPRPLDDETKKTLRDVLDDQPCDKPAECDHVLPREDDGIVMTRDGYFTKVGGVYTAPCPYGCGLDRVRVERGAPEVLGAAARFYYAMHRHTDTGEMCEGVAKRAQGQR